ncbi:unnamed protein product [Blepharisma stoltei]|uniref:Autophagy-related protein 18 n=1 Tax=Blepharisma stoltei TaxID=1481888 RepID=A0AAU9ISG6_9CILI|nr:unnamed protein product [Blepharisma stoltei]
MESEEILHLSFNQDRTLLTLGSRTGFKVFKVYPLELIHQEDNGNFKIVEMYESSLLVSLVGAGEQPAFSPRRLTIWNIAEHTPICETSFPDSLLSVKMNRIRIVAVISDAIYIYDTTTMKTQNTIRTVENPKGLAALSPTHSACWLLYPSSVEKGNLQVYDCFNMQLRTEIEAHTSKLAYIAISYQGNLCATASEKGTVIRVFSLPEGNKLFTFKRGLMAAITYSINFSMDAELLLSCSDTGTIHVYNINRNEVRESNNWGDAIRNSLFSAASYIVPGSYKDSFETSRSYIVARTNFKIPYIATLIPNTNMLLAVNYSGHYIMFSVDYVNGGDGIVHQEGSLSRIRMS